MATVRVASLTDVPEGEGHGVKLDGHPIALFKVGERVFAMDDICSHAHAFLSEGDVDDDDLTVECPRHGSTFELETGKPTTLPATLPVRVYPVTLEGDDILIEVSDE
jgi:3-phenylpropionate/trans-cinnamate dioxygenase ferredoxin subunit